MKNDPLRLCLASESELWSLAEEKEAALWQPYGNECIFTWWPALSTYQNIIIIVRDICISKLPIAPDNINQTSSRKLAII